MNTNSDQVKDKMVLEEEEKEEVKTDSLSSIGVNSHKDNEGEENEGKEDDMTSVGFALGTNRSDISEKYTRSDSAKDLAKPADPVSRKPKKLRPISSRKKKSFKTSEGSAAAGYSAADGLLLRDFKLENLIKIFKCAGNDDIITIKGDEGGNTVTFMFESPSQDKIADFEMKLKEHLGIPDAEYQAIVRIPSAEFARICEDLSTIGDTVVISVTKEGVKFSTKGDFWTANIVCRQNNSSTTSNEEVDCSPEEPQK